MNRKIEFRGVIEYLEGSTDVIFKYGYLTDYFSIKDRLGNEFCIDPKTVGQFTGLKDKNGIDIYEGDIVKTRTLSDELNENEFQFYKVSFFNGTFCLFKNGQFVRQWKDGTNDWYSLENTESFEIEVVGNIHENKELVNL